MPHLDKPFVAARRVRQPSLCGMSAVTLPGLPSIIMMSYILPLEPYARVFPVCLC